MCFGYLLGATPARESTSLSRLKLFEFFGGRPNQGSPRKFGGAFPLLIVFKYAFFAYFFFEKLYFPSNVQTIIFIRSFLGGWVKCPWKNLKKNYSQRKLQERERLQI
jgi:hypothetical protein